ncbi:hypothetical protein, partial [Aphanothece stagnina]|uniref:hypothetical protein n=1 Tax=Aphanothece stagnina TaxID=1004305 RepID=UPI00398E7E27
MTDNEHHSRIMRISKKTALLRQLIYPIGHSFSSVELRDAYKKAKEASSHLRELVSLAGEPSVLNSYFSKNSSDVDMALRIVEELWSIASYFFNRWSAIVLLAEYGHFDRRFARAEELYSKLELLTSSWDKKQTKFLESAITQKLVNELKSNSKTLLALLFFGLLVAALALYLNTIYLSEESIRALNESSSSIGSVLFIASKLASTSILFLFLYFIIGQ